MELRVFYHAEESSEKQHWHLQSCLCLSTPMHPILLSKILRSKCCKQIHSSVLTSLIVHLPEGMGGGSHMCSSIRHTWKILVCGKEVTQNLSLYQGWMSWKLYLRVQLILGRWALQKAQSICKFPFELKSSTSHLIACDKFPSVINFFT